MDDDSLSLQGGQIFLENIFFNKLGQEQTPKSNLNADRGCGSIGRAVASNRRGMRFKCSHQYTFK